MTGTVIRLRFIVCYPFQDLFMFERLTWTFQLLMRAVEDLPQLLMSLIFLLNNGKDVYVLKSKLTDSLIFILLLDCLEKTSGSKQ